VFVSAGGGLSAAVELKLGAQVRGGPIYSIVRESLAH